MSGYDEIWSRTADTDLNALDAAVRDQAAALVREICLDPMGPLTTEALEPPRTRVARTGRLVVYFQVDELDRLVYVRRVVWRG